MRYEDINEVGRMVYLNEDAQTLGGSCYPRMRVGRVVSWLAGSVGVDFGDGEVQVTADVLSLVMLEGDYPKPPYCAGYRPMKAAFLPGQRVTNGFGEYGVFDVCEWLGDEWSRVTLDANGHFRARTFTYRRSQLQHLPFKRSPS